MTVTPTPRPELGVILFPSVAELRERLPRLLAGIVVLGFGVALIIQARLGVSPYDVLHQGLAEITGLSFGVVVVLLGLISVILLVVFFWVIATGKFSTGNKKSVPSQSHRMDGIGYARVLSGIQFGELLAGRG